MMRGKLEWIDEVGDVDQESLDILHNMMERAVFRNGMHWLKTKKQESGYKYEVETEYGMKILDWRDE